MGDRKIGHVYHRLDPLNDDHHLDLFLYSDAPSGDWQLKLHGEQIRDGRYHAWIERDSSQPPRFRSEDVERRSTLGTLANGAYTITTGAYDPHKTDRPLGSFSSAGPTRTGRLKPEIVAPGVRILAARSTPENDQPLERFTRKTGTSMAAPHVAGTVALMFETIGRKADIADTRALLFSSLSQPPSCSDRSCSPEDIHRTGYGYLDIANAVAAAEGWRNSNTVDSSDAANTSDLTEEAIDKEEWFL